MPRLPYYPETKRLHLTVPIKTWDEARVLAGSVTPPLTASHVLRRAIMLGLALLRKAAVPMIERDEPQPKVDTPPRW